MAGCAVALCGFIVLGALCAKPFRRPTGTGSGSFAQTSQWWVSKQAARQQPPKGLPPRLPRRPWGSVKRGAVSTSNTSGPKT